MKIRGHLPQGGTRGPAREETFERQKRLGVVPTNAKRIGPPKDIAAWDSLDDEQRRLFARFMAGYAGNLDQTDYKAIEDLGQLDNTRVTYVAGDLGASAEARRACSTR